MRVFGSNPIVHQDSSNRVLLGTDYLRNWSDYMGTKWQLLPIYPVDATCDGYHWHLYP